MATITTALPQQYTIKIQEYREKRAKYDPVTWSRCNICKEKYPNDEIVNHIHQKHPEKDCSTFSCWTCGIKFRREAQMKRHMKTVKHQLEAKKFTIPDEEIIENEVQLLILNPETDVSKIQLNSAEQIINVPPHNSSERIENDPPNNVTFEATTEEIPLIDLQGNLEETEDGNQYILNDQMDIFEATNIPKNTAKNTKIEEIVDHLLDALNEPSNKEEIMEYIHKEDDTVELEIDDWLTMDSWGNTPAVEDLIPLGFEDL